MNKVPPVLITKLTCANYQERNPHKQGKCDHACKYVKYNRDFEVPQIAKVLNFQMLCQGSIGMSSRWLIRNVLPNNRQVNTSVS